MVLSCCTRFLEHCGVLIGNNFYFVELSSKIRTNFWKFIHTTVC